jgi:hypothetical protein
LCRWLPQLPPEVVGPWKIMVVPLGGRYTTLWYSRRREGPLTTIVTLYRRRDCGRSDPLPGGRRSERRCRSAVTRHRTGDNSPSTCRRADGLRQARVPTLWPQRRTVVAGVEPLLVIRDESVKSVTSGGHACEAGHATIAHVDEPSTRGWHRDPAEPEQWRHWDGKKWTGRARVSAGGGISAGVQIGPRRARLQRIGRTPIVFYPLAWLNCSVPLIRGRLDRFAGPREIRELRKIARNPPPWPPSAPGGRGP